MALISLLTEGNRRDIFSNFLPAEEALEEFFQVIRRKGNINIFKSIYTYDDIEQMPIDIDKTVEGIPVAILKVDDRNEIAISLYAGKKEDFNTHEELMLYEDKFDVILYEVSQGILIVYEG